MQSKSRSMTLLLTVCIALGTLAGLLAAYRRFHIEMGNRKVEIGVEWVEVSELADITHRPVAEVLQYFHTRHVSALIVQEDTFATLEQAGTIRVENAEGPAGMRVHVADPTTLLRIEKALRQRGYLASPNTTFSPQGNTALTSDSGKTIFVLEPSAVRPGTDEERASRSRRETLPAPIVTSVRMANLRLTGVGLPPEAVEAAAHVGLRLAARVGNFPGVSAKTAESVLRDLQQQGASTVIFSGEESLGYRGVEKTVADLLRSPGAPAVGVLGSGVSSPAVPGPGILGSGEAPEPTGIRYGAVEFSKQKGDTKISGLLKGDFVRVHAIQAAEMSQLEEAEVIDRFVRAARERNIRFCYVRLMPFAGDDPVAQNGEFLAKIAQGMARGSSLAGGSLGFGAARPYPEPGISTLWFALMALGVAAGFIRMLRACTPLPGFMDLALFVLTALCCLAAVALLKDTGRTLVALLAGIVFPTAACLRLYPRPAASTFPVPRTGGRPDTRLEEAGATVNSSLLRAVRGTLLASVITLPGIIMVVGLLTARPFMVHSQQFLGIKAQHAAPLLLVGLVALAGGVATPTETWARFRERAKANLRNAYQEPARFGLLLVALIALLAFVLLVVRTGNDAGVGVSGAEMKFRALLDRALPVRPRTKEFLIGHPAFLLGLAWWWRRRRRLAIPMFVVGSLGQVSLLNTFCHIHTPLVVSAWRGGLGLGLGIGIGAAIFVLLELFLPAPLSERESGTGALQP